MRQGKQPSPGVVFPSSHCSTGSATTPSPQVEVQTDGSPVHWKPLCTRQMAEQPSPLVVFPSSQPSPASMTPSPHGIGRLDEVVVEPATVVVVTTGPPAHVSPSCTASG